MDSLIETVINILVLLNRTPPAGKEISKLCDILIKCIDKLEKAKRKNRGAKVIGILTSLTDITECRTACTEIQYVRNKLCHTQYFSKIDDYLYADLNKRLADSDLVLSNILQRLQMHLR